MAKPQLLTPEQVDQCIRSTRKEINTAYNNTLRRSVAESPAYVFFGAKGTKALAPVARNLYRKLAQITDPDQAIEQVIQGIYDLATRYATDPDKSIPSPVFFALLEKFPEMLRDLQKAQQQQILPSETTENAPQNAPRF